MLQRRGQCPRGSHYISACLMGAWYLARRTWSLFKNYLLVFLHISVYSFIKYLI